MSAPAALGTLEVALANATRLLARDAAAAAEQAAEVGAGAATWVFVALVLGAAAAALGGWLCAPERTITVSPRERRHDREEPAFSRP